MVFRPLVASGGRSELGEELGGVDDLAGDGARGDRQRAREVDLSGAGAAGEVGLIALTVMRSANTW